MKVTAALLAALFILKKLVSNEIRATGINQWFRAYSWFHNYMFLFILVSYVSASDIKNYKSGVIPLHPATYEIKIPNLNLM